MDKSQFPLDEKKPQAADPQAEPGSVTGMFEAVSGASKAAVSTEDILAGLLRPQGQAPVAVIAGPVAPKITKSEEGSVTRMLRELQTPVASGPPDAFTPAAAPTAAPPPAKIVTAPVAKEAGQGEFTSIFKQIPILKPISAAVPVEATVLAPTQAPIRAPILPEQRIPEPGAPTNEPGEFTQFLQKMSGGEKPGSGSVGRDPVAGGGAWPADVREGPPLREAFESLQTPEISQTPRASDAPGSFTQLFKAVSPGSVAASPAAPAPVETAAPAQGPGSFTQMFQAIASKPAEQPPRPAPAESLRSVPVNQGGFTQLLDSLSAGGPQTPLQASTGVTNETSFPMPAAPAARPFESGAGEFTRLMRTLSDPPPAGPSAPVASAAAAPVFVPPPAQPLPQSGPGEYTRIISNSALREAGGSGAAFPPLVPAQSTPPAFPSALPPLPHLKAPAAPHPPAAPAGFGLPQAFTPPAAPSAAPPAAPSAAVAPQSKLQQYLPLILVINVALLLILVMILFFALRRH